MAQGLRWVNFGRRFTKKIGFWVLQVRNEGSLSGWWGGEKQAGEASLILW
ncbi:MAG: hypothetical protein ACYCYR_10665 [Desulfobulbaceae bacterium]